MFPLLKETIKIELIRSLINALFLKQRRDEF